MDKICLNCGAVFSKKPSDSKRYWAVKRYCSIACSGTLYRKGDKPSAKNIATLRSQHGDKGTRWKGGRAKHGPGYITLLVGVRKRQLEHRYVMEQHLGRKLLRSEHVHHINNDKADNRLENLMLLPAKEHNRAHTTKRYHPEVEINGF